MATQAERRASTRGRLLEAAMASLVEDGYVGFTTSDVVRRSGCSRGALFDHFPSKDALLAATIEHLFDELRADYQERFARLRPKQRTLPHALRLLRDLFDDVRLLAAYELYGAARTSPELRAALEPVVTRHNQAIYELAAELPLGDTDPEQLRPAVALAVYAYQGLALQTLAQDASADRRHVDDALAGLVEILSASGE